MRIAYLTTCSPIPPDSGHSLRVNANWQALRRLGHVDLWAFDCRPPIRVRTQLRAEGIHFLPARHESPGANLLRHMHALATDRSMLYAKAMSAARTDKIAASIRAQRTDLLVIGDTWLADLLPALRGAADHTIVDTHNVESKLYARMVESRHALGKLKPWLFQQNVTRLERQLRQADAVWAVSPADAVIYGRSLGLTNVAVVPNAINTVAHAGDQPAVEPGTLVFTGSYGYWPNEAAALELISLSLRLEAKHIDHRVLIVGRNPTSTMLAAGRKARSVTITGSVPDIHPFIARAALIVAPLTSGSGTKYKILEALAAGRPVVTTPIGAEGLALIDGENAAVAPDLSGIEPRVIALLADPARAETLARLGQSWVLATHSFDALNRSIEAALRQLPDRPRQVA